jgi:glucosyl-dolichyl phosphate glucuronosyltransferase
LHSYRPVAEPIGGTSDRRADISVVISTRDRCGLLDAALKSLLAQERPAELSYEIIVVDNHSSDGTRDLVERLAHESGGCVRYLHEGRVGVSHGRNTGIQASSAPIIAFTDDDNVVDRRWIATVKMLMDEHPDVAAVGGKIVPEWKSTVPPWLDRKHWSPLAILDYGDERFHTSARDPRCLLTANLAFRRWVFDAIGLFSPQFQRCQDHELLVRLWRAGLTALYAPELVVYAPVDPDRLTKRYHRAWHSSQGRYSALMRREELIDGAGELRARDSDGLRLAGVPRHVYAELFRAMWCSAVATVKGDSSLRLRCAYHARYLRAYIGRTVGRTVAATAHRQRMSLPRLVFVHALLAALVGGSLYEIRINGDDWPLSSYPMFSTAAREPSLRCLRIMGIVAGGAGQEIPLLDTQLIQPFDQCRLTSALSRTYTDPARRSLIHEQLRDCLDRYEQRRAAGQHDGPRIDGVRLYEMEWTLDADAANVSAPDSKRLVDTVHRAAPASMF